MRKKKFHINWKKLCFGILILLVIALIIAFTIKSVSHEEIGTDVGEAEVKKEEKVIPKDITINLVSTGDIMCHSTNFKGAYDSQTKKYDFAPAFANVAKYITKADIAIR